MTEEETEENVLDRIGNWSLEAMKNAANHPAITVGAATVVLFVVARIPTQIFYSHFGIRPEDVGLDSVQVLLQGATAALLLSFGVGVVYGLLAPITIFTYFDVLVPLYRVLWKLVKNLLSGAGSEDDAGNSLELPALGESYRTAARRSLRMAPLLIPLVSVAFAIAFLSIIASDDAGSLRKGYPIDPKLMPWKADPVGVTWTDRDVHPALPDCHSLFYLGEGDGRVVLFDSENGKTYRINSRAVELAFPHGCSQKAEGA